MRELFLTSMLVFKKDFKSELRTRYVINALVMFVLVSISIIRFSLGDEKIDKEILTGLLWVVIFFTSASGLSRAFVKEEEKETSPALKLSMDYTGVFIGKAIFNFVLSFSLNILILILYIGVTGYEILNPGGFLLIVVLGNFGLVGASTVIAAIISKANSKGTLYPVLSFPILIPLLISVINASKLASLGVETRYFNDDIMILISYSVVVITASLMLFKFIWED